MPYHGGHVQFGGKSSGSAQPIDSLADLVLDLTNFSAVLASTATNDPASPAPKDGSSTPSSADNPVSKAERRPGTSIADLVLNNITYDAILASSARGLGLESGEREPEDVRAPPNSPVQADVGYGSLLGVSTAIMEGESK